MTLLLLAALLQEPDPPPARKSDPVFSVALLASYFEIHQPDLDDAYGPTLLLTARFADEFALEAGGRWFSTDAGGTDADLGLLTLGVAGISDPHGSVRGIFSAGVAVLASDDLDDDVDFGGYAAFTFEGPLLGRDGYVSFRYEVIVPETDAGFGGRELEMIQGFSVGFRLAF